MARPVNNPPLALAGHAPSDVSAATRRERHARHQRAPSPPACWQQSVAPSPRYLRVQLSGAHGGGRSTGALLLPPGRAVVCGEPGRTLARDERRSRRRTAWRRSLSPGESRRVRAGAGARAGRPRRACGVTGRDACFRTGAGASDLESRVTGAPAQRPPRVLQPGDCERGDRARERGAASQHACALPMRTPGQEEPGRADAPRRRPRSAPLGSGIRRRVAPCDGNSGAEAAEGAPSRRCHP